MATHNVFALLGDDVEDVDASGADVKPQAPKVETAARAPKPGRREHDRHSGTGRGREVSKGGGGGKYTFGSSKSDARAATNAANKALHRNGDEKGALEAASAATSTAPDATDGPDADDNNVDDADAPAPAEPQKPQMTLKEYRAVQSAEKVDINSLLGSASAAPAAPSKDDPELATMTALKKGGDDNGRVDDFPFVAADGAKKKAAAPRPRDTNAKGMSMQQFMQQGTQPNGAGQKTRRDGATPGPRGGQARGASRAAPSTRGGASGSTSTSRSNLAPNVTDLSSFPKLGL